MTIITPHHDIIVKAAGGIRDVADYAYCSACLSVFHGESWCVRGFLEPSGGLRGKGFEDSWLRGWIWLSELFCS